MNISIVKAIHYHDSQEIASVINRAYARVPFIKEGISRITVEEIITIIRNPDKNFYLCLEESKIRGTALIEFVNAKPTLSLFAVDPSFKGKNIGTFLLDYVEEQVRQVSDYLYLKVIPLFQETLIKYYQKRGFVPTGQIELLSEETLHHAIDPQYRDIIHLEVMRKKLK